MPVTTIEQPVPYEPMPHRLRWTNWQCDALRNAGYITGRYELVDGEIISKMGQNPQHARRVGLVGAWLARIFGTEYVRTQATIDISGGSAAYDEPEPDAVVTTLPESAYEDRHPTASEIRLLVEVSDTTLRFDRSAKAAMYASAGIHEYWVADSASRRIFVHRAPAKGAYQDIRAYGADEEVSALAQPDVCVLVGVLLP